MAVLFALAMAGSDWLAFSANPSRTGLVKGDRRTTKRTISRLKLRWKLKLDSQTRELTSLTAPLVVTNVKGSSGAKNCAIVAGSGDNVFAIDADKGSLVWLRYFDVAAKPKAKPDWLGPNALTATPVIDRKKMAIYVLASDGQLHTLSVATGRDLQSPRALTPPFAKNWSLNLFNGTLYTPTSQACNMVRSAIYAVNADTGASKQFLAMRTYGADNWGRAGVAISRDGTVFAEAGDGVFDPEKDQYPNAVLAVDGQSPELKDYSTPTNHVYVATKDLEMGNMTPAVFPYGKRELVAATGKEGVIYLLGANAWVVPTT